MHIEKNICDSIMATIMDVKGKTKDNINSRRDLQLMKIRPGMHPDKEGDKPTFPSAPFTLLPPNKILFLRFFKDLEVPDGFCSNLGRCTNMKEKKNFRTEEPRLPCYTKSFTSSSTAWTCSPEYL